MDWRNYPSRFKRNSSHKYTQLSENRLYRSKKKLLKFTLLIVLKYCTYNAYVNLENHLNITSKCLSLFQFLEKESHYVSHAFQNQLIKHLYRPCIHSYNIPFHLLMLGHILLLSDNSTTTLCSHLNGVTTTFHTIQGRHNRFT